MKSQNGSYNYKENPMHRSYFRALLPLVFAGATLSHASTITGPFNVIQGTGSVSGAVGASTLGITESITSFNPFFVVSFLTPPVAPATQYGVTKTVTNNTGFTWTDFQIGLGCTATQTLSCGNPTPLTVNFGLGLTSSAGGSLSPLSLAGFAWNGINVAPGQSVTFTWNMTTCANCTNAWTMTQLATGPGTAAPEPATAGVGAFGVGLITLGAMRRRKKGATPIQ